MCDKLPFSVAQTLLITQMYEAVPLEDYPDTVPSFLVAGTAFFPGGCGLYLEDRDPNETVCFPMDDIMILGHNYDCETGFRNALKNGKDILTARTWQRLPPMLIEAGILTDNCFFTNAFMGLCPGDTNTAGYMGRIGTFREKCMKFLKMQIEFQCPRLIVTLGVWAPTLLAEVCDGLTVLNGPDMDDPNLTMAVLTEITYLVDAQIELDAGPRPIRPW